ncbi:MAG: GNAT family N-acetyltransferase [Proteobacteria bacterium]|nr:GNAT family N-acetyltransferase [Pseudomonadota bacterium]
MARDWHLETDRLQLRSISDSDAPHLLDLNSDPMVMKYLGKEPVTADEIAIVVEKISARDIGYQNQLGLFMTFEKSSGEFVGWFVLRPSYDAPDDRKNLEIGWRLKQKYWGRGFGTEGALALKNRAITVLKAERLFAVAKSENTPSLKIMEKIGLQFEKTYVDTDEYWHEPSSVSVYSLLMNQ